MPTNPDPNEPPRLPPRPIPGPEDYEVFEVDGFAQLTPEQKLWPVVPLFPPATRSQAEEPQRD